MIQCQYRKYRYFRIDPPIPSVCVCVCTWCVSEGQGIDNSLSLHREEQSTPIGAPASRLTSRKADVIREHSLIKDSPASNGRVNVSPDSVPSDTAIAHRSTSWSPTPCSERNTAKTHQVTQQSFVALLKCEPGAHLWCPAPWECSSLT